jgi:two-component system, chemotaxis family, protein-glutamate methylesterase/glutaminase
VRHPDPASPRVVAIGASAGGLDALKIVLRGLPADYPWPVLALLHSSARYGGSQLDQLLQRGCALAVSEAQPRQAARAGAVHLAPAGYHLLLERDLRFSLSVDEKVSYSRPSIDVLFDSVADACGSRAVGVILTGTNDDGAAGLAAIRARGGLAIVQDPAEAQAPEMPQAALDRAGADHILRLKGIAARLAALPGESA